MVLQSMTGFARREGTSGRSRWAWELRSVNGKGLDVRLRLPPGLERLETDVRKLITDRFSRGNLQVGLSVSVDESRVEAVVNQGALATVLALRDQLTGVVDPAPLRLDTLLGIPREGFAFSRNPPIRFGAPRYDEASFRVGDSASVQTLRLRYLL